MSEGKWMGISTHFLVVAIFSGGGLFLGITVTSPVRWHALCCNKEIHKFASFLNTRDIEGCGAHPGVALVLSPYLNLERAGAQACLRELLVLSLLSVFHAC